MARYVYPAVFTSEEEGGYSVSFPDLEGCYTCGDNLQDAIFMAGDALALALSDYEEEGAEKPKPSKLEDMEPRDGEFVQFIMCDLEECNKMSKNNIVLKLLAISAELNNAALEQEIDLSQVLQEALMQKVRM